MSFAVFYAWQSDRNEKVNHYLIRDALQDAVDVLNADLRIEEAPEVDLDATPMMQPVADAEVESEIEVDFATKNEPGTVNVAEAIFRKISECGVFLADITFVGEIESADGRKKYLPNSNVLIELGQASASVGWRQILLVQNTHFGGPENLPFDLKNYSFPIRYTLAPGADKKTRDAERKNLSKHFIEKLKVMHKHGVWMQKALQAKAEADALEERAKAEAKTRASHERKAFESKLQSNDYYGLKSKYAVFAAVVTPVTLPKQAIKFDDDVKLMTHFQPPGVTGCQIWHRPKSVTLGDREEKLPYNMVELTNSGSVYMARNLAYGRDGMGLSWGEQIDPSKGWVMPMDVYQPQFIDAVQQYLKGLVALGISGPWFFSMFILKMNNGLLIPSRTWYFYRELGRRYEGADMHADMILIPTDLKLSDKSAVTEVLKPPLKEIWRHNGHRGTPIYDGNDVRIEA